MKAPWSAVAPILASAALVSPAPAQCPPDYVVSSTPAALSTIVGLPGEIVLATNATLPGGPPGFCVFGCAGTPTAIFDDEYFGPLTIPFPFYYYGNPATDVFVDTNGFLQVGVVAPPCATFTNLVISDSGAAGRMCSFWDDVRGQSTLPTCRISYRVDGPPGARSLTFQWTDLQTWNGPNTACNDSGMRMTHQVVLHEASNDIEFRYAPLVPGSPAPAGTVGISDVLGSTGTAIDFTGMGIASAFPTVNYLADACTPCTSIRNFGDPCPASITTSGGAPTSPNPAFTIGQAGAPPGVPAFLVIGLSNTSWVGLPLPLDFSLLGLAGGCHLLASVDVLSVTVTNGSGASSAAVPIPPGIAPCAGTVYAQWANLTAGPPLTVTTTDGLILTFG